MAATPQPALRRVDDLPCPPGLPLLGNARQITPSKFHATLENWAKQYGPLYRFRMLGESVMVINDHRLLAELLRDRPEGLARSRTLRLTADELGANGVFSAEGERWRNQRKLVMRALTPEAVRHFFPTMERMTGRLLQRWQEALDAGRQPAVARDLKAWAMDIVMALSFGADSNVLQSDDDPLQRDVELMFTMIGRRMVLPVRYWNWLKLPIDREADRMVGRITERVQGFIAQSRARLAANPALRVRPSNMLEAMVVARDEPGSGFTDEDVIGNAITLVFAGEDTAATTLGWLLYFLSTHPDATAAARAEADTVLGNATMAERFDLLGGLNYIEAAAMEAMRIKPVAPLAGFEVLRDRVIGDVSVSKGARVFGLMRSAGLDDAHFPDAQRFDPQRWLASTHHAEPLQRPEGLESQGRKIFPFGAGPRLCPGRYLALCEIRMATSMIVKNFELSFEDDPSSVEEIFALTMNPSHLPVRLARRAGT
jgi:cytochrome P450